VRVLPLDEVLRAADYVTVHTPLNEETRGLLGEREFRLMKPTAYVINTARGPVIDHAGLYRALSEGWIAGAGLDVHEVEPVVSGYRFLDLPNVVLTPHSAFYSEASVRRQHEKAVENVVAALSGQRPPGLLNADVWSSRRRPAGVA
jgi:phosphoglycerate dehydrogenase-like enzyme